MPDELTLKLARIEVAMILKSLCDRAERQGPGVDAAKLVALAWKINVAAGALDA
jgi:hypothetical protein